MAFSDKKGITVASPFKLQAESMLDVRQQVDTIEERNELVTIKAATAGLRVYVKATKKSYVYNGTSWDTLSVGDASLIVKLNGGTSEGTNQFTYNGTAAKSINITPSAIGAAPSSHTHTKSQITDFPTSMKNPQALKFAGAVSGTYDGSAAVTITIPNTANTAKSLIVKLNNGDQEGTDLFTFNGSTEKTINITPGVIGAAPTSHTHNISNITGLTAGRAVISDSNGHPSVSAVTSTELSYLDGVTSNIQTQLNNKANATHTHNYAGSSSAGGAANSVKSSLIVKLNSGSTEGTNMFTFNGSAAKTINITPALIGAAPASHTHTKAQITDFPTAMKNPQAITFTGGATGTYDGSSAVNINIPTSGATDENLIIKLNGGTNEGTNQFTFNGEVAKTINITPTSIGAAASSHTHNYAGSSSAGGAANSVKSSLTVQLNGGTTEGTNKFTFNGSAAKTINITPALIGAAPSSHTHTKAQITDFPTAMKNPQAIKFTGAVTGTYDGSAAVTIDIPTSGASTAESLVIKLNGGTTEGTNQFTFNGGTSKSVNITPASIGAAAASHGTHVTYGSNAPKASGTASAGSASTVSRSDHVHPAQTYVQNAGSAIKLATARTIDGVSFNGTANITHYGTCSTAAGTAAKTVSLTGFTLATGAIVTVKFTVTNTAANPTLNVNNTGAKAIQYRGSAISAGYLAANRVYTFIYDGTNYQLIGDINTDTNTTYNTGTSTVAGITKLYTGTGSNTDGTMTQDAITDALNGKAASSHSHSVASTSAAGFLRQLSGSTSQFMRGDGTWATPPNTTYSTFKAATSSAAGGAGLVPAPAKGYQSRFLRGDATWQAISLSTFGVTATAAELNYMDGVTSNVQTQLNGKANSSHTHNYAGSSSAGGAATSAAKVNSSLVIKLNGGTTEGTNQFTFNGSAAKSVNITASSIGAAASSHTHGATSITGLTANRALISNGSGQVAVSSVTSTELGYLDGVTSNIQTQLNGKAASNHNHNYAGSSSAGGAANSANRVPVPVGTVLFSTSSSTTFFNSCFGGTWEVVGNIDAIVGTSSTLTLYMFKKTAA